MDTTTQARSERVHTAQDTPGGDHRSIIDLVRELRDETTTMVRQEVALAKHEISEKVGRVGRNTTYIAIGGVLAFAGLLFLLLAATYGLAVGLEAAGLSPEIVVWLAPLIIGAAVAVVGYALVQKGISTIRNESAVPEKTAHSLQENKEWIAHKTR